MHRGRTKSALFPRAPERINFLRGKMVVNQRRVREESIMSNEVNKQTPDTNRQESKIITTIITILQTKEQQNYRNS